MACPGEATQRTEQKGDGEWEMEKEEEKGKRRIEKITETCLGGREGGVYRL